MKALRLCILFAAVTLVAQQATTRSSAHADYHWQPPQRAMYMPNPLASDAAAAASGGKLFRRNCAQCHGARGHGIHNAPDLTRFEVQVETDGALFWKITNGNLDRGMPSFSNLPRLERWQLVLYLRELGK